VGRQPAFDWTLFILGVLLSVSGLVFIYSATWVSPDPPGINFLDAQGRIGLAVKQGVFLLLSLIAFYFLRRLRWGLKPGTWLWFYLPAMFLLVLVLFIGRGPAPGVTRWINLYFIDVQPSEFAKLALILILAWLYSEESQRLTEKYLTALALMLTMLALVALQPDLGTAMVFLFIFFVMSAFIPIKRRWLVATALAFIIAAIPAWFLLHDYQKNRILVYFGLELVPAEEGGGLRPASALSTGYHVKQSLIAVGSGGWTGKGFLRGTQVRGGFVPEVQNDFIFALVAEEFGFFGCAYLLLLYFLLLARILALSRDAVTLYERYICYGTSAVIFFHVLIAAGMTVGLTPVTGLPLPFVSYGGSSLMTMWLLLAINASVHASSRRDYRRIRTRR